MPSSWPASLAIALGQHSLAGRHGVNQDFHGAMVPAEPLRSTKGIAVALADGIGSSAVSQVASAAAVRGFLDDYYATSEAWPVRRAAQCVLAATNAWLHAQTARSGARFAPDSGYVCTFSALVFKGREAHLLHVGDSRIYRLHAQALEQLTEDHRIRLSSQEVYLGRALGAGAAVEIDYHCWPVEVGEVYLLATDGAHEHLDVAAVHAALAAHGDDLDAAAAALAATALARGSDDDITVQLARVEALPPEDPLPLQRERLALRLPPPLAPRERFEGCTIVRALHVGPRSHVHLAVDDASGRPVVIKTPAVDGRGDAGVLDAFLLEEWAARRVDSVHVLRPAAIDRPREHLFVAMEYVEGQTLAQWMTDHPAPSLDEVRGLVAQAARGLQALHRKAMLHQDLRPENVMIDREGTVRLIDLGSVHVPGLVEGTVRARPESIVGTLQYTAPEYFLGDGGSTASDLYALAAITYQMLCGQLPYGLAAVRVRTPADARRLRYVPLRHHRPDLPAWLDAVLRKALQPDPGRRQEAVSEFVHDLHAPGPSFLSSRPVPLAQRNPVVFWQVVSLVLALTVILLIGLRATGR